MPRQITALATAVRHDGSQTLYAACADGSVWHAAPWQLAAGMGWEQLTGVPDPEPPSTQAGDWDHAGLARSDSHCLDLIQAQLDGEEWNADTLSTIAELVRSTGRCIDDLEQGKL